MPRRKQIPASESDARLAFGIAAGWSALACCRFSGQPFLHRQAAHAHLATKLADETFRAQVEHFREQIAKDEMDTRSVQEQVRHLNRDWVLSRLKKIYQMAMGDSPVGIDETGQEQFLPTPHLGQAIKSLVEIGRILQAAQPLDPETDDDLEQVLREIRAERNRSIN